ncbi:MAG: aromatic ring-hydroxylating dioxygenase subunit alpha [Spartobacteria bacterium]
MPTATDATRRDFRKTTETFTAGAKTLPQRYFVWPEVFAEEQMKIFSRQWVCVGHQSQVPKTGDYIVQEVAGESVIVVRDQEGGLRGFYNVCRHRGTRLCEEASGHAAALQCPYHAWTYALDGRLLGAPHMDEARDFAKGNYALHSVRLEVWEGLLFVSLEKTTSPLEEVFAPLAGKFTHWNLPRLRSARRIEYEVSANWKLIFQNYSECYHCPGVHPLLSKISPSDSAENDLCEGPFLGGFMSINAGKSLTMSGQACARPVGDIKAEDHARVFYYSIFPNLLLSMHPDYVMVHQLWPQSPERTLVQCDWFFHPDAAGVTDPKYRPEDAIEFWDMTNKQDWHVCELSQQGIASCAYQPGPYSPRESIPAAWDREYLRQVS